MKNYPCKDCIIKISCNQYCFRYIEEDEASKLFTSFMDLPCCPDCGYTIFDTSSHVHTKFDFICQECHAHFKFRFFTDSYKIKFKLTREDFSNSYKLKLGLIREYYRHFTYDKVSFKNNIEVQTGNQIKLTIEKYIREDKK